MWARPTRPGQAEWVGGDTYKALAAYMHSRYICSRLWVQCDGVGVSWPFARSAQHARASSVCMSWLPPRGAWASDLAMEIRGRVAVGTWLSLRLGRDAASDVLTADRSQLIICKLRRPICVWAPPITSPGERPACLPPAYHLPCAPVVLCCSCLLGTQNGHGQPHLPSLQFLLPKNGHVASLHVQLVTSIALAHNSH